MQASASVTPTGDSKAAIGEALKQALSGNRLQSISLHDERGDVLWLDEGALGPDEHNLVVEACSALSAGVDKLYLYQNIGDGRAAAFLPARSPLNDLVGIAMIIADAKFLDSKGAAKFVSPTTTNLMRRLAFLRKPPAPAPAPAPAAPPAAAPAAAAKVVSPPAPRPAAPAPAAKAPVAPGAARPAAAAPAPRPGVAPPKPAAPVARPAAAAPAAKAPPAPAAKAPPPKPGAPAAGRPAAPSPGPQRQSGSADSDSIAFEISDIDPKSLLKPNARPAAEPKRPDLRVVQTDRLPKLEIPVEADPIPELIADDSPPADIPHVRISDDVVITGDEETAEVEALLESMVEPDPDMNVAPEYQAEEQHVSVGPGQFEFYGQVFELHVQQLVKLKGTGGTRRFEVLVRDANADNEFGVAPDRVLQDVHDPSANSDLDRIVVEQLVIWMDQNRGVWESEPASFSVNVGMGTIADPKFASFVALTLKNHKVPAKALGFEITEKSCVEQVRDVDNFVVSCEKIGCHVVLDDFTMHHNALRWLGSPALKFLKLDSKITAVAMKERVPQALVVAIAQASKVLGLSCVAKRVDTPAVREWLSAVGLDYAQGFLLDQPRQLATLKPEPQKAKKK
ncbi:MAG TPA: EAL domain-containing protein [Steroidobacteraceae bacterium]|nr:EAL domain-containing protein [Steroidobacteraceae bacterium]